MTSKMPAVYVHYFGTESSNSLLEAYGIIKDDKQKQLQLLQPKLCPNCNEPNKRDELFCIRCKMVLTYDAYRETLQKEDVQRISKELYELAVQLKIVEMEKAIDKENDMAFILKIGARSARTLEKEINERYSEEKCKDRSPPLASKEYEEYLKNNIGSIIIFQERQRNKNLANLRILTIITGPNETMSVPT